MAISSYEKGGQTVWKVYVNIRSRVNPSLRVQRRVLEIPSEREAKAEEKRLLRDLAAELTKLEGKGFSWSEIIDRWESAMLNEGNHYAYQATTVKDHVSSLKRWTTSWLNRSASDITRADGRIILNEMEQAGRSRNFRRNIKNTINVVYTWGMEEGLMGRATHSPVEGIHLAHVRGEKVPDILTIEEIRKLLQNAKELRHEWYSIWAMALLTGMRNGELHALLWSDIDLASKRITVSKSYNTRTGIVKSTKSGQWRTVPISDELEKLLIELKTSDPDRAHVLPHGWEWDKGEQARILRMFCQSIGIRSVKFHALRACFATQLLANDVAPARVMKICGWRDLKTMQYYIRLAGVDEQGATQSLRILPSDAAVMGEIVDLLQFKTTKRD